MFRVIFKKTWFCFVLKRRLKNMFFKYASKTRPVAAYELWFRKLSKSVLAWPHYIGFRHHRLHYKVKINAQSKNIEKWWQPNWGIFKIVIVLNRHCIIYKYTLYRCDGADCILAVEITLSYSFVK